MKDMNNGIINLRDKNDLKEFNKELLNGTKVYFKNSKEKECIRGVSSDKFEIDPHTPVKTIMSHDPDVEFNKDIIGYTNIEGNKTPIYRSGAKIDEIYNYSKPLKNIREYLEDVIREDLFAIENTKFIEQIEQELFKNNPKPMFDEDYIDEI